MDLVTLIAACAIGQDPAMMQALVLRASAGHPYSYHVVGEAEPRSFPTVDAVAQAARAAQVEGQTIRLGLAGITADMTAATAQPNEVLFEPCVNLDIASRQLRAVAKQCGAAAPDTDPTYCALGAYLGSLEQPAAQAASEVFMAMTQPMENPEVRGAFEPIPSPDQQAPAEQAETWPGQDRQQEFLDAGGALFIESRDQAQQPARIGEGESATSSAVAAIETDSEGEQVTAESLFVSSRELRKGRTQFINLPSEAAYDDQ
ncbi:MAG: hypothetical protein L0210_01390 [Rhodospirillales bacterium]|nr:hypothetical protein [Rhodospirillales bacterium]